MTPDAHDRAAPRPGDATAGSGPRPGPLPGRAAPSTPPPANRYAHTRRTGPYTVVVVTGEIDVASADLLAEHLTAAVGGPGAPDVLVDLREVAFLDCSGLRVLCRAEATARAGGGRLRLVCDQPRMHRLLRAARLLGRFPPLADLPSVPPGAPPRGPSLK
ncbi:STAS domain-containing protein [Streptomyces sp. VNUA24]|uniref:STAS domain-containing protein n=1 Tax=Streptomyces sp. VNUA24 TaxID=3031131 RepID=UPI0023B86D26|nr:STAS domain-containing protein [Streptomyces sp. VNUA24]WEH13905.1 STAS domain-containing protein [Streptomyces sp. VNUA24]